MATISSRSEDSAVHSREEFSVEGLRWAHVGHQVQGTLMLHISPPRKGHSQQIFRKKAAQHRHPSSSHCCNPRRSFYHTTWGCAAQTLCLCPATPNLPPAHTPAPSTGNFPHPSMVSKLSWFLCAQDILLSHTWQLPHCFCTFCRCFSTERGCSCPPCNSRSEASREEHIPSYG